MNVTIVGHGYVGQHLETHLNLAGHRVSVYDPPKGMNGLKPGEDAYIICVPTPLTKGDGLNRGGDPDLSDVIHAADAIDQTTTKPALIVLESTVGPGDTRACLAPLHERGHLIAYSPERIDPGTQHDYTRVPKLVAGINPSSLQAAMDLYSPVFPVYPCDTLEVAELAKLHENAYRAVNIALVSELTEFCETQGVDVNDVLDAADTKPYGFQRFNPSAGPGGHCIPVDPAYLLHAAQAENVQMRTLTAAHTRNTMHQVRNVDRVVQRMGKLGGRVAVLGLTYKPGTTDTRNSAGTRLADRLGKLYDVEVHDPTWSPNSGSPLPWLVEWADLLVVCTPHREYLTLAGHPKLLDLTDSLHDVWTDTAVAA